MKSTKINPKNDFYSYINKKWLNEYKKEQHLGYIVEVDNFRLVQDKVYRELIGMMEKYIKMNDSKKSICVKNLYKSQQNLSF